MKGIISTNKAELDAINTKINDWMYANIPDYNAVRWGNIYKHPTEEKWVLAIGDDSRNPLDRLSTSEKTKRIEIDRKEWFSEEE